MTLAADGRNRIQLIVRNEGTPIPPQDLEHIFERFYRADQARTSEGFGLGLAIAREIAREHKGKLWAESSPERGNSFLLQPAQGKRNRLQMTKGV